MSAGREDSGRPGTGGAEDGRAGAGGAEDGRAGAGREEGGRPTLAARVVPHLPPHLARLLSRTAPANVRVIQAAAGDRPGMARLWLPQDDPGDRGVSSLVRRDIHARAVPVRVVALDDLGLRDVGFVKVDVDGNELAVLRGATALLARDRPALFVELESRIQPVAPVVTYLGLLGYEGWVLPSDRWVPLAAFPLREHQAGASHVASHGLLRRVLPFSSRPRYVNSVLFLPDGRRPGGTRVRDDGGHAVR
ncbi:FkbM family methyltransferase [Streptomyces sp. NPDC058739]|uniref:FkbM family methyltransferase n=1 Tax=Streptomyces sp. NPDC058739 TaxID=3346618 RepID=UPI0036ADCFE0